MFKLKDTVFFSYRFPTGNGEVVLSFRYSPRDKIYFMDILDGDGYLLTNLPVLPGKVYDTPFAGLIKGHNFSVMFFPLNEVEAYDTNRRLSEQIEANFITLV